MATKLQSAKLNFGIPGWASEQGFSTKMILRATVYVKCKNGSFVAHNEVRNRNIFPAQAIPIYLQFESEYAMENIQSENILSIKIIIQLFEAQGTPEIQNNIRFRTEAVLLFMDGTILVSPGPEPAGYVRTGLSNRWEEEYLSNRFSKVEGVIDSQVN